MIQRFPLPLNGCHFTTEAGGSLLFPTAETLTLCGKTLQKTLPEVSYWAPPAVCNKETKSSYKKPQSHKTPCALVINIILGRFYEAS